MPPRVLGDIGGQEALAYKEIDERLCWGGPEVSRARTLRYASPVTPLPSVQSITT
jgi:hypothetical protein